MKKQRKGLSSRFDESTGNYVLRLYNTDILKRDGYCITLNSGGWKTNHTKKCINENLPNHIRVFKKDFTWYVQKNEEILPFTDNMIVEV